MSNIFNSISLAPVKTNVFDLSYDAKLSLNMGELTPIHCSEVVPGDKYNISTESLLRFAPLIAPVMHKVDVYTHFFFVPNRILWSGWEDFITDQKPAPAFPYLTGVDNQQGTLGDYLGLPIANLSKVSALPFSAYQAVYNEYYRDQNLVPEIDFKLSDGAQTTTRRDMLTTKRKRAWEHDYFTSALPFAQKGDAVEIPLGDVVLKDNWDTTHSPAFVDGSGNGVFGELYSVSGGVLPNEVQADGTSLAYDPDGTLQTQSASINELRRAFKLQEWLEKNARGGTRYIENILSHFGVRSSDARLQRPQYLGGNKQPMVISEVLQTAEGTETPQGNMAGHGISVGNSKTFKFSAEEHGYIIGIMSVMPKTAYFQGIPKHFTKFDRLDYYWPSFAHLGEQEIKNQELYYDPANETHNQGTFGYIPRYAEYKYHDSRVAGDFRTNLAFWHLARGFSSAPALNKDFIECEPSTRIFAVEEPSFDKIYAHVFHKIKAVRKMPKYGTPSF